MEVSSKDSGRPGRSATRQSAPKASGPKQRQPQPAGSDPRTQKRGSDKPSPAKPAPPKRGTAKPGLQKPGPQCPARRSPAGRGPGQSPFPDPGLHPFRSPGPKPASKVGRKPSSRPSSKPSGGSGRPEATPPKTGPRTPGTNAPGAPKPQRRIAVQPPLDRREPGTRTADRPKPGKPRAAGTRLGARRATPPPREESVSVRREPQDLSPRSLLKLYRPDVAAALADLDSPSYRYAQAFQHFFQKPMQPFSEASVLPADLRANLDGLGLSTLTLAEEQTAADGTTKILLATTDGSYVESVVMRYRDRVTLCISSQIGCPVGCVFCATGSIGFERNLSVAEIADQVRVGAALAARDGGRVSNIVYMGMGEPLLNLQAVLDSIRVLTNPDGFGLSHRSLCVDRRHPERHPQIGSGRASGQPGHLASCDGR